MGTYKSIHDGTPAAPPGAVGTPQPGRRVRVTFDGTVNSGTNADWLYIETQPGSCVPLSRADDAYTVEVLPDPEPAWWPPQPGDVANRTGTLWQRTSHPDRPWRTIDGSSLPDDAMRGATLLVRGGKPYTGPDLDFDKPVAGDFR